jgi:hypothetical protein
MARWLCPERELLSVISSDVAGAWEKLILDWMIRQGMYFVLPWEAQLEAWEVEFVIL